MPHYLFKVQSDGCEFDLKAASFLDQEAAEKFARGLCAFFHPRRWSPRVVVCDSNGEEVFRSAGPGVASGRQMRRALQGSVRTLP